MNGRAMFLPIVVMALAVPVAAQQEPPDCGPEPAAGLDAPISEARLKYDICAETALLDSLGYPRVTCDPDMTSYECLKLKLSAYGFLQGQRAESPGLRVELMKGEAGPLAMFPPGGYHDAFAACREIAALINEEQTRRANAAAHLDELWGDAGNQGGGFYCRTPGEDIP